MSASRRKFLRGAAAAARAPPPRLPDDRQGAGPDLDALAEHLAGEGHLPRVRERLREEGERHDRRRPQDRGAAAGAVVPAFGLLDAVTKGTLDGGHGVLVYHYGKQNALALWGSGPAFGMDANQLLAWHKYGGGKELLTKLYASIGANVVSFPYGPMPTQPLGWFKKPVTKVEDLKGSSSAPWACRLTCSPPWVSR